MNAMTRFLAGFYALAVLAVLAFFLADAGVADRRIALMLLAAASLVGFARPGTPRTLVVLIPLGPVLDFFFMTPGNAIYALEVVLSAALIQWCVRRVRERDLAWNLPETPVLLWGGFALVGIYALNGGDALANDPTAALRLLRVLILALGAALMVRHTVRRYGDRSVLPLWTAGALAGLVLIALGAVVEYVLFAPERGHFEPGSFYRGSIGVAVHVAFFSPLALSVFLSDSGRKWRIAGAVAWLAGVLCLPLTASRGGLGSVLLVSALLAAAAGARDGWRRWRKLLVPAALLAVLALIVAWKPELAGESFAYKWRATLSGDFFSTRRPAWNEAFALLRSHPLTGVGPSAWAPSIPLELALRHGLPAAVLALGSVFWAIVTTLRKRRATGEGSSAGLSLAAVDLGLGACLVGLLLVGLAETGLGARTTPLLAAAVALAATPIPARR
jgi:hypothetical protein